MTQNSKSILVAIIGIFLFCTGAGLRLQARSLSTFEMKCDMAGVPFKDKANYNGQKFYAEDSDRKHSITDISLVLIWAGGALVVLSLAVWLFAKDHDSAQWSDV